MSSPLGYNCYIALDLDLSVTTDSDIREAIKKKRNQWSQFLLSGSNSNKHDARKYLTDLPEIELIMLDRERRQDELKLAQDIILREKKVQEEKLDDLINQISEDTISKEKLKLLRQKLGSYFSESELRTRLLKDNIKVEEKNKPSKTVAPTLVASTATTISEDLNALGLSTLYEFISQYEKVNTNTNIATLHSRADAIESNISALGKTDPKSTVEKRIAGQAKVLFKDKGKKAEYDNYLKVRDYYVLNDALDFSGKDSGYVNIEPILIIAGKNNLDIDKATNYIESYTEDKGWRLAKPSIVTQKESIRKDEELRKALARANTEAYKNKNVDAQIEQAKREAQAAEQARKKAEQARKKAERDTAHAKRDQKKADQAAKAAKTRENRAKSAGGLKKFGVLASVLLIGIAMFFFFSSNTTNSVKVVEQHSINEGSSAVSKIQQPTSLKANQNEKNKHLKPQNSTYIITQKKYVDSMLTENTENEIRNTIKAAKGVLAARQFLKEFQDAKIENEYIGTDLIVEAEVALRNSERKYNKTAASYIRSIQAIRDFSEKNHISLSSVSFSNSQYDNLIKKHLISNINEDDIKRVIMSLVENS